MAAADMHEFEFPDLPGIAFTAVYDRTNQTVQLTSSEGDLIRLFRPAAAPPETTTEDTTPKEMP